jgi:predicted PurR-regulated permease PerM
VNIDAEQTAPGDPDPAATLKLEPTPAERADSLVLTPDDKKEFAKAERRALGYAAIGATLIAWWLVLPVGGGILLGMLGAFILQPVYERLSLRVGTTGSALLTALATALALVGSAFALSWMFISGGTSLVRDLLAELNSGGGLKHILELVGKVTSRFGLTPENLNDRLRALAEEAAQRGAAFVAEVAAKSGTVLLALFLGLLTLHFMLPSWRGLARKAEEVLPLRPDYTRALFDEFRTVGRTTLLGTLVTGLAQGVFATIGYAICGVPKPLFFGAATAVASLLPGVGTMLVWVPAGVILLLTGHAIAGIGELLWGALTIVGLSDYVIRPRLVGGEAEMPSVVTFAALFGGVEAFGIIGLVIGPMLMSLAIAVIRLYSVEASERRQAMIADARRSKPGVE